MAVLTVNSSVCAMSLRFIVQNSRCHRGLVVQGDCGGLRMLVAEVPNESALNAGQFGGLMTAMALSSSNVSNCIVYELVLYIPCIFHHRMIVRVKRAALSARSQNKRLSPRSVHCLLSLPVIADHE